MTTSNDDVAWVTAEAFAGQGFQTSSTSGSEREFGSWWGPNQSIRLAFAETGTDGTGFLYAHDQLTDQYAVLNPATTIDQVSEAWRMVSSLLPAPDGYLLVAAQVSDAELTVTDARALWRHCLAAEFVARADFELLGIDAADRFVAAHAVVLARGARVATEDLLDATLDSAECEFGQPVVVRYRILDRTEWTGHVAGRDVTDAAFLMADLATIATQRGFRVQATSLSHGNVVVAASRVPELSAVTITDGAAPFSSFRF